MINITSASMISTIAISLLYLSFIWLKLFPALNWLAFSVCGGSLKSRVVSFGSGFDSFGSSLVEIFLFSGESMS
jgi:hypothetical protein